MTKSYANHPIGRLFAQYGMAGWWKIEYESMTPIEIIADLEHSDAPASPLLNALRAKESQ